MMISKDDYKKFMYEAKSGEYRGHSPDMTSSD